MNDASRAVGRPDDDDAAAGRSTRRSAARSDGQRVSLPVYVGLTFALTWLLWIPGVVVFGDRLQAVSPLEASGFFVLQTLGAAGPSIAAWIVLRWTEGPQAVRRIGDRYRRWKVGLRWYVAAVVLVPAVQLAVLAGDAMIGDDAVVTAASPLGQMLGDLGVAGLLAVFPLIVLSNVFSSPLLFVDDPDWDFRTAADDDPADLVALYKHACERSRQAVASVASLDDLTSEVPRRGGVQRFNLRWVLLHMIEETARHAGHADLLREAIDGVTGE